jgi:hypothetical protein
MSNISEHALVFTVQIPKYMLHVLQGVFALAFFACWLNGLSLAFRALLAMMVIGLWLRNFIGSARGGPNYLRYTASQCWYVSYDGQEYLPISIEPDTVVTSMLLVLHYQVGIADKLQSRMLFITRHSMPVSDYRRLLVRLRLSRND